MSAMVTATHRRNSMSSASSSALARGSHTDVPLVVELGPKRLRPGEKPTESHKVLQGKLSVGARIEYQEGERWIT
jgi:hypothetical protein